MGIMSSLARIAGRGASEQKSIRLGAMTANEVRAGLNLTALPEGNELSNPFTTTPGAAPAPDAPKDSQDE